MRTALRPYSNIAVTPHWYTQETRAKVLILPSKLPISMGDLVKSSGDDGTWGAPIKSDAPDLQMIVQNGEEVDVKVRSLDASGWC